MWSSSGMTESGPSKYSMSVSMYRGGGRGGGRPRTAPPDLPSLLLDARICYLGMPLQSSSLLNLCGRIMIAHQSPIYLYINSSGTQNEKMETVGFETEAYAIVDTMVYCKSPVYTVNCGMAYGQVVMLLALGAKGFRALQPNCSIIEPATRQCLVLLGKKIKMLEPLLNGGYYLLGTVRDGAFEELCDGPLGAADYFALLRN